MDRCVAKYWQVTGIVGQMLGSCRPLGMTSVSLCSGIPTLPLVCLRISIRASSMEAGSSNKDPTFDYVQKDEEMLKKNNINLNRLVVEKVQDYDDKFSRAVDRFEAKLDWFEAKLDAKFDQFEAKLDAKFERFKVKITDNLSEMQRQISGFMTVIQFFGAMITFSLGLWTVIFQSPKEVKIPRFFVYVFLGILLVSGGCYAANNILQLLRTVTKGKETKEA